MSTQIPSSYYLNGPQAYSGAYQMPNAQEEELLLMQGQNNHAFKGVQGLAQTQGGEADDGKIGFFDKVGSMIKGAGKAVVNFVSNPANLLMGAACIGLCLIPGIGPVLGAGMAIAGGLSGLGKMGESLASAAQAQTDEQARAAFENLGAGALQTGLSVVGAKASIKGIKANNSAPGALPMQKGFHPVKNTKTTLENAHYKFSESGPIASKIVSGAKDGTGIIGKARGAANGAKEGLADTRFGKTYMQQAPAETLTGKAGNVWNTAKQIAKENKEARAAAKDPESYVASKVAEAENKLDNYINTPKNKDGKYVKEDGVTEMTNLEHRNYIAELKGNIPKAEIEAQAVADSVKGGQLAKELGVKTTKPASNSASDLAYYNAATGRTSIFKQAVQDYKDGAANAGYISKTSKAKVGTQEAMASAPAFGYLTPNANSDEEMLNLYYGY